MSENQSDGFRFSVPGTEIQQFNSGFGDLADFFFLCSPNAGI